MVYLVKKLKMKYAGHLARIIKEQRSKRLIFWVLYDHKRSRGRPTTNYREEITERVDLPWYRATQNRIFGEKLWTLIPAMQGPGMKCKSGYRYVT